MKEHTHLKDLPRLRNTYLLRPFRAKFARSLLRTILSQITTSFFTPFASTYSACRYRNSCLVFQWNSGDKSVRARFVSHDGEQTLDSPAVRLKFTNVTSCQRLA